MHIHVAFMRFLETCIRGICKSRQKCTTYWLPGPNPMSTIPLWPVSKESNWGHICPMFTPYSGGFLFCTQVKLTQEWECLMWPIPPLMHWLVIGPRSLVYKSDEFGQLSFLAGQIYPPQITVCHNNDRDTCCTFYLHVTSNISKG